MLSSRVLIVYYVLILIIRVATSNLDVRLSSNNCFGYYFKSASNITAYSTLIEVVDSIRHNSKLLVQIKRRERFDTSSKRFGMTRGLILFSIHRLR